MLKTWGLARNTSLSLSLYFIILFCEAISSGNYLKTTVVDNAKRGNVNKVIHMSNLGEISLNFMLGIDSAR